MDITELRKKVELGMVCHKDLETAKCCVCPYKDTKNCGWALMNDALKIADHYKAKYESTLLATPPMILHTNPAPIAVTSSGLRDAARYSKALNNMADAGNRASEALREATKALRDLKEEMIDFDEK